MANCKRLSVCAVCRLSANRSVASCVSEMRLLQLYGANPTPLDYDGHTNAVTDSAKTIAIILFHILPFYCIHCYFIICIVILLRIGLAYWSLLEFSNPGSFCKPGFSDLGKVKPGFGFGFGSHVFASVHCKLEGGSAVAVGVWIGWANFFGSLSIISCSKISNIVGLIL